MAGASHAPGYHDVTPRKRSRPRRNMTFHCSASRVAAVFCTLRGQPMSMPTSGRGRNDPPRAGIDKRVHAHGLRHPRRQLRAEGIDIAIISRQLGHFQHHHRPATLKPSRTPKGGHRSHARQAGRERRHAAQMLFRTLQHSGPPPPAPVSHLHEAEDESQNSAISMPLSRARSQGVSNREIALPDWEAFAQKLLMLFVA